MIIINWLKNNWSTLLVFVVVLFTALWIKGKFDESETEEVKHQYIQQLDEQRKTFDSQIKDLKKVNDEAMAKQKELALQHQQTLENLQSQYDEKIIELEDLKKVKVKEITKQLTDDPEVAVEELAHKFGLEVIVVPEGDL